MLKMPENSCFFLCRDNRSLNIFDPHNLNYVLGAVSSFYFPSFISDSLNPPLFLLIYQWLRYNHHLLRKDVLDHFFLDFTVVQFLIFHSIGLFLIEPV